MVTPPTPSSSVISVNVQEIRIGVSLPVASKHTAQRFNLETFY